MAVMAAGMHNTILGGTMVKIIPFHNRQGIHICAQAYRPGLVTDLEDANDSGLANASGHLNAEFLQLGGHECSRALFLQTKFGMGMNITPPGDKLLRHGGDFCNDGHGFSSCLDN
jgi:hypothetical protein